MLMKASFELMHLPDVMCSWYVCLLIVKKLNLIRSSYIAIAFLEKALIKPLNSYLFVSQQLYELFESFKDRNVSGLIENVGKTLLTAFLYKAL